MKKIENPLTATEMLNRIRSQWANKRDVMDIGFVGDNKATSIMNELITQLEGEGYKLPAYCVPMIKVIEYFKIDIKYLKKIAKDG